MRVLVLSLTLLTVPALAACIGGDQPVDTDAEDTWTAFRPEVSAERLPAVTEDLSHAIDPDHGGAAYLHAVPALHTGSHGMELVGYNPLTRPLEGDSPLGSDSGYAAIDVWHNLVCVTHFAGSTGALGGATIVDIAVTADIFTATYTIFLPGVGNWGGSPGPESEKAVPVARAATVSYPTSPDLAALYRLTGDLHPIHIDPAIARANGFDRPILHGLCTLGIAARALAGPAGAHPADLTSLSARLSAPVLPGDTVTLFSSPARGRLAFEAAVGDKLVLKNGHASYAQLAN